MKTHVCVHHEFEEMGSTARHVGWKGGREEVCDAGFAGAHAAVDVYAISRGCIVLLPPAGVGGEAMLYTT